VSGVKADYSVSLSAIIRHSMSFMKDSELKELVISTGHDDLHVCVKIEDTGAPVAHDCSLHDPDEEKSEFSHVLSLLKKYGVLSQIVHESGFNVVSIRIPYRGSGVTGGGFLNPETRPPTPIDGSGG